MIFNMISPGNSGGGGSTETPFQRVIQTITTEDKNSIVFTKDSNGNDLSFDEAYLAIVTARAASASSNGTYAISLKDSWDSSFNSRGLHNMQLTSDAYLFWFHIKKVGEMAFLEILGKKRIANNLASVTWYPSEATWAGSNSIGLAGNTAQAAGELRNITSLLDDDGKIHTFTIGTDLATSVAIGAGTRIEMFAR